MIDSVQSKLELNAARTLDEELHKLTLRNARRKELLEELTAKGTKTLRNTHHEEAVDSAFRYKLLIEELFDATEHPLYSVPEEVVPVPEPEYGDEEEDEDEDDDAEYFKPGEKRRRVRPRKLPGEEANRFSTSSKRARFNLTQ